MTALWRRLLFRCPTPRCRYTRGHAPHCADRHGRHLGGDPYPRIHQWARREVA